MIIKRNSKLIRWAYLFNDDVPCYTSLCPLFWRVVLVTPFKVVIFLAIIGAVVGGFCILIKTSVVRWDITFPVLGGILFIVYVIHTWKLSHSEDEEEKPSLIKEYAKSVKNKVCPIVEIQSE